MSRYDWGQRHPGIYRLEALIADARTEVVTHPVYARLDNLRGHNVARCPECKKDVRVRVGQVGVAV